MRFRQSFKIDPQEVKTIKLKVLQWLKSCDTFSFLDNNAYNFGPNRYELLVGAFALNHLKVEEIDSYESDWIFGQLKFEFFLDKGQSKIFCPQTVIYILHNDHHHLIIESIDNPHEILTSIDQQDPVDAEYRLGLKDWQWNVTLDQYLDTVTRIREDIFLGNYYEINYCVKCTHQVTAIDPIQLFIQQKRDNPAPFSALMRMQNEYIICSSPERFIYKNGGRIISQPIKGTVRRGQSDSQDDILKEKLRDSIKDRAENVMIVDLTRNDLYRCCQPHSVVVSELFGIYTFPFVHQMISTIEGDLRKDISFQEIINVTYPMGSMTGAPKKTVVDHIQQYEPSARGPYSGSVFYLNPDGDFDSNVVIRSLFYNADHNELSFYTGGAITYDSTPEGEWEEILVKSQSMRNI